MLKLDLLCAFLSVAYGITASVRKKMPLFFKILFYGFGCHFLGILYLFCYQLAFHTQPQGLHIGLLGTLGMYFFLISSYVGAIDRLADGGEKCYRSYRIAAALPSALLLCGMPSASFSSAAALILAAITSYFACKHLILPDVEMGIIKAMRPYNALILIFCLLESAGDVVQAAGFFGAYGLLRVLTDIILVLALPAAGRGVKKWFI